MAPRATQPEDEFHLSLRIDSLFAVQEIRLLLDVDTTTNNFTRNFYQYTFTANDIISAIQSTSSVNVTPLITAIQNVAVPRQRARIVLSSTTTQRRLTAAQMNLTLPERQLALGNNQWIELHWKVKDMIRVGTDTTRSLADVKGGAIYVQYDGNLTGGVGSTLHVDVAGWYLTGGFGPDATVVGIPYSYIHRFRSSVTGEKSNPGPPIPSGVIGAPTGIQPRRQRVILKANASTNPNADLIDWFRIGGTLLDWSYAGSVRNTGSLGSLQTFNDDLEDGSIKGGEPLEFDNFQLWPTTDLPRRGVCNTSGSAVQRVSGDSFNTIWSIGSQILINGIAYTLYSSPASTSRLTIVENAGALTNATFELPGATLLQSNLPAFWGPDANGIYFGVGDVGNPGRLYWTKANNPDTAADKNFLDIVSPSTPLIDGYIEDGLCFVASSEDVYRIVEDPSGVVRFRALLTPCGRGFWFRKAHCDTPFGHAFVAKDGIFISANGNPAQSITNEDFYPLFPHDGIAGVSVNGYDPPDYTLASAMRLTYVDGMIYFDYGAS